MKRNLRSATASTSVLAVVGGVLAATVGTAAAASAPPWETSNANALGTLSFYNSLGAQITGGSNDSHIADYVLASTPDPSTKPGTLAQLAFANPQNGVPTASFHTTLDEQTSFPNAAAPGALGTTSNPLVSLDAGGGNLAAAVSGFDLTNPVPGFTNVYQIRVFTSGPGAAGSTSKNYWTADIQITPATGAWTQVFGTATSTTTTVTAAPNPQSAGSAVQLTATVTNGDGTAPAGTVTFTSGGNTVGSSSTFNASGQATASTSALPQGTDTITATFVPSSATYTGSNDSTSETITAPVPPTTTTLGITGNSTTGTDATLSGTVSPAAAAGTVEFFDNGTSTPIAVAGGPSVTVASGSYSATLAGGFTAGSHSVVAKFTSADPASFGSSQSAPVAFSTVAGSAPGSVCSQPGSQCSDTQTIQGEIPVGTLVISTPYTDAKPLDVGALSLSPDGTFWTGHAVFDCITVTDSSSGGSPFIVSGLANPLSQVPGTGNASEPASAFTTINGQNVGLTGFAKSAGHSCPDGSTPVNSYSGTVTGTDQPAAQGVVPTDSGTGGLGNSSHVILTGSAGGEGTATYDGTLTLNAPTSTAAGTYKGTILFTVSD